ncbi:MAG: tetratricopeptide repeat protein [Candidatus Rokuibacteriota bacterium]
MGARGPMGGGDPAAAWNNFAHALARQQRRDEAIAAAETALRLAPGDVEAYRATLTEVSR